MFGHEPSCRRNSLKADTQRDRPQRGQPLTTRTGFGVRRIALSDMQDPGPNFHGNYINHVF
jgi:hypothetical protein